MNPSHITDHSSPREISAKRTAISQGSPITNHPKVSIIILNWNGVDDTIECLESLKNITYPNYEVIVVDNASSGDDVRILKGQYEDYIHMIANDQNYGFPEGCNVGMRYALSKSTNYLLLLNNDTTVDGEFLTELVKVAEGDPSIGIVGSKVYYYHYPNMIQSAGGRTRWWLGEISVFGDEEDVGQYDEIAERDYVYGTSFLIKKVVIDKISFMDPYFFMGIEEYDYCTRAIRAGFKVIYVPESKVWHKAGASQAKLPQFPEAQSLVRRKAGFGDYKYYYRLFRAHCMPVLFIFPFLVCTVRQSLLGDFLTVLWRGDWQRIKSGIAGRLKSLLKVTSKSHSPH